MNPDDFFEDLSALQRQIVYARHQDFQQLTNRLFALFDEAPASISNRVRWLREKLPRAEVEAKVLRPQSGIGSGTLAWPLNREERLGGQLNLLEQLAASQDAGWKFAFDYFRSSSRNIDDTLHTMTSELVDPMLDELARYLERNLDTPLPAGSASALDRIVPIDHSSVALAGAVAALRQVRESISVFNDIEVDERDRILAELDAGSTLLGAPAIRLSLLGGLAVALGWILDKFAEAAFAPTVQGALQALKAAFPELPI